MNRNFGIFVKNEELDHSEFVGQAFKDNQIDFPECVKTTVESAKTGHKLRTSQRILSYLTRDLNVDKMSNIQSFTELQKRINDTLLIKLRDTGCFGNASIEGQFSQPISKYQWEQLDLNIRLIENPIFSTNYGLSINESQRNIGIFFQPVLTNMLGQCEQISFDVTKTFLDYYKDTKLGFSVGLPYSTPDSFSQQYSFLVNRKMNVLKDLQVNRYKLRSFFNSKTDPRWSFSFSSRSNHYHPLIDSTNAAASANSNSIFDLTRLTYQNVLFKTQFIDSSITEQPSQMRSIQKYKLILGLGCNSLRPFAKVKYSSIQQEEHLVNIGDTIIQGVFVNRLKFGGIFADKNLHFSEQYSLVNQPSFSNINLNHLNINSPQTSQPGSRFFFTNQTKYIIYNFPFLQRIPITPFLHLYTAFVPTDMNVTPTNKIPQYLRQNLRLTAGVGLTYQGLDFNKIDLIYSFANLLPKGNKDEFSQLQLNFYS